MDDKQFEIICEKLDKIATVVVLQNIEDKNQKISLLKKSGMTSAEIAALLGMTESGIRDTKGWKRK